MMLMLVGCSLMCSVLRYLIVVDFDVLYVLELGSLCMLVMFVMLISVLWCVVVIGLMNGLNVVIIL